MKTTRLEFSKQTKEERWTYADGRCEYCRQSFGQRRPDYHHHTPAALGGDNSYSNCRCICSRCHRLVTKQEDIPRISKAKRIEAGRANFKPKHRSPFRKLMDGSVIRREASDPDS